MKPRPQSQINNERYLETALTWLRLRLSSYTERRHPSPNVMEQVPQEAIDQAAVAVEAASKLTPTPSFVSLSHALGLNRCEEETLLLCAAMVLDTRFARLCALAHDNSSKDYPTFALALALSDEPSWDILSPNRPLRYWQLIELGRAGNQPITASPLQVDERIVNFIKGVNYLDDRLTSLLTLLEVPPTSNFLPPSQLASLNELINRLERVLPSRSPIIVQLLGIDSVSKTLLAHFAAAHFGLQLYRLPAELLPSQPSQLKDLTRLWQREQALLPVALYIDAHEADDLVTAEGPFEPLNLFLGRSSGLILLDTRDVRQDLGMSTIDIDVVKPTPTEQRELWASAIGATAPDAPNLLAGQFNLNTVDIQEIMRTLQTGSIRKGQSLVNQVWETSLKYTRPRLDTLAQRLTPIATWDDIVLPEQSIDLLKKIVYQVRLRSKVYDDWGFRRRMNRGFGIAALFVGESGTGKTMGAEVIANELNLNLYRIDLSSVVSKYIGETEKNLRRLFDAAEDGGAILFFDEADALFGKRSQVRDSHDRYANIEINYLLQRLEAYHGLAILATNMKSGLDDAFMRRLRFIVYFPVPELEDRKRMWQQVFPPETPLSALDYDHLSNYKLTGGTIYNAALGAAFMAAQAETPVTMDLTLDAIRTEFQKLDRLINESDFLWETDEL